MKPFSRLLARACVAATLLAAAWPAAAGLVAYTDRAAFLTALGAHGTDSFDDLAAGAVLPGPLARQAGTQGYRVSVPDTLGYGPADFGDAFYPVAPQGSPALSPNFAAYALAFEQFGGGALRGFGADFFATDVDGAAVAGTLQVSVTVGGAVQSFDVAAAIGGATFWGLLSTNGDVSAWSVAALQGGAGDRFATVDNLALSAVAAVPEPSTLALLLAGGLGLAARRRR